MIWQNEYSHVKQGKSGRTPVKAKPTAGQSLRIFSQGKKATIAAVHRVFLPPLIVTAQVKDAQVT
jgi:hypothetical protein